MKPAARVANPVSGRVDAGYDERPVTTRMVACRYAMSILLPVGFAGAFLTAGQLPWWAPLAVYVLVVLPLSAGANGSWWRAPAWGAWQLTQLAQVLVVVVAAAWTILADEPMVMVVAAALLVGATFGVGGLQLLQRRGLARR